MVQITHGDESEDETVNQASVNDSGVKSRDLLTAAKSVDFDDGPAREVFERKYRERLRKASKQNRLVDGNILHNLASESEDEWWANANDGTSTDPRSFLRWIVEAYPEMLECHLENNGYLPLHTALYRKKHEFVGIVLDKLAPESSTAELPSILVQMLQHRTEMEETCLYLAVKYDSEHATRIIKLCARVVQGPGNHQGAPDTDVFGQASKADGQTALHCAVRLSEQERSSWDLLFVTEPKRTLDKQLSHDDCELVNLILKVEGSIGDKRREIVKLLMSVESKTDKQAILTKMEYKSGKKKWSLTPFQAREADLQLALEKMYQSKAKKELEGFSDPVKTKMKGAARGRLLPLAEAELCGTDDILTMMKLFCIHKFRTDRKKLRQALYEPGNERHLEFSLSGLRGQTVTKDYLKRLVTHLKFDSILTCVSLPSLIFETTPVDDGHKMIMPKLTSQVRDGDAADTTQLALKTEAIQSGKGRRDLVSVFTWLRENNVRMIKRVVVIDDGDRPHSDEAIEQALEGFDVEFWDWKKPDICSDVIYSVAPNVKEVSLYWSGNAATILGWYSNEGFANREKFKQLKKILLYYDRGLESTVRLKKQIEIFKTRIEDSIKAQHLKPGEATANGQTGDGHNGQKGDGHNGQKGDGRSVPVDRGYELVENNNQGPSPPLALAEPEEGAKATDNEPEEEAKVIDIEPEEEIKIIDTEDPGFRSFRSSFRSIGTRGSQSENKWLREIQPISKFIRTIPEKKDPMAKKPTVSIAIIDDGIDAFLDRFNDKIISGASFCSQNGLDDSTVPYFVPSSEQHGTLMAALILRIFPRARLYVAKLDERSGGVHGKRHITVRSAAEAIEWAIRCKVDIISMSWTIERSSKPPKEIDDLTTALQNANSKGILMLCAASDQGSSTSLVCYPASSGNCIRVGACTDTDDRCDWVHQHDFDILLPGENVPLDLRIDTLPTEHSGSSVATAIASGLAGLILYLAQYSLDEREYKQLELTKKAGMIQMFATLAIYGAKIPRAGSLDFLKNKNAGRLADEKAAIKELKGFFKWFKDHGHNAKL